MRDAVDRLTPLGVVVLALLREGDMHPYEMMRLMRQRRDDRLVSMSNGTLYHTVARLQREGMLAEVGVDREGNRPERTIYTLTDAGRDVVPEWVRRELSRVDHPAEFRIALAESHNLSRIEVVDLLTTRRSELVAAHAGLGDGLGSARSRSVPEQFLLELDREQFLVDAELRWLDAIIDRLDRHEFPWGVHELAPETIDHLTARKALHA